ncbi:DUF1864 family protein [Fulvivirga sp. RKSG066]|uniref:monodechloroaminopyrrolnitrin synthase PrnB family protein n=1 Tax=Fulvivirga aurantia TaxID=2529383 RepID=UPI0012BBEB24|nr:monodechloroaminopyrrolnitrin synthase PrnB family protein [Fulvivirga aurantia]MTI19713.1 DUF1864 family protein [Fulvivirga aurantia]
MTAILQKQQFWYDSLKQQGLDDQKIASLDPLGMDEALQKLPSLNANGEIGEMVRDLYKHLPFPVRLERFSYQECLAAMRDIGLYLGSIKKHGKEPLEEVPELDYVLGVLSEKTDLPPRDTLLHYSLWNPEGERMRTYTHYEDERELIRSVKVAMTPLFRAIYQLIDLYWCDVESEDFSIIAERTKADFRYVIDGVVIAKKNVSPALFARELRLYFDPIEIYKEQVIGPGAVEMPLFVYDYILWGSDVRSEVYQQFSRTYVPFTLPWLRDVYFNFMNKPSLVTKVSRMLASNPENETIVKSAKSLLELCKLEKSFRMPHKKMAEESYLHEPEKTREKGSGGYSTSILGEVLSENIKQMNKLDLAIKACQA